MWPAFPKGRSRIACLSNNRYNSPPRPTSPWYKPRNVYPSLREGESRRLTTLMNAGWALQSRIIIISSLSPIIWRAVVGKIHGANSLEVFDPVLDRDDKSKRISFTPRKRPHV